MATIKAKATYRSAKMRGCDKARWINKWLGFHEAYPSITMEDWCRSKNIAPGTFFAWLKDPKYNKGLREDRPFSEVPKKSISEEIQQEEQQELPIEEAMEEPRQELTVEAEAVLGETLTDDGAYVVYTSADCRIEFSKTMGAEDIARVIASARRAS